MGSTYFCKRAVRPKRKRAKTRPKTFKTEASANAYAKKQGIKKYKLVNIKSKESSKKKIKIVKD